MNSKETTITGILQFIGVLASELPKALDNDPLTVVTWGMVFSSFMAMIGLIRARDNNVTSRKAGAE